MLGDLKIIGGSSHPTLVKEICRHIGIAPTKAETVHFANDNMMVRIDENVRQMPSLFLDVGAVEGVG